MITHTRRTVRHDGLDIRQGDATALCDGCGRSFPAGELTWSQVSGQTSGFRRGEMTDMLCGACDGLAWVHCWRCGKLTIEIETRLCPTCEVE